MKLRNIRMFANFFRVIEVPACKFLRRADEIHRYEALREGLDDEELNIKETISNIE